MKVLKLCALLLLSVSALYAQKTQVNALNNVRYTDTYYWQRFPSADLSVAGAGKTITLPAGILGIDVSATATKPQYIYIDTVGTAEAALITGGTYTAAAGGTVIVTTANAHAAGYRVGSATSGIQEALNDAGTPMSMVKVAPSKGKGPAGNSWPIYAPIIVAFNHVTIDFGGASLNCFTRSRCIQLGSLANSLSFGGVSIINPRMASSLTDSGVAISNTVCSANTATITTASPHTFVTGDTVDIQWTSSSTYWGGTVGTNTTITVTGANTFTFTKTGCSEPNIADVGYAALQNSAIEDNTQGANIVNVFFSTPGGITGKFQNGIVIDNDQAAKIVGLNQASTLHCTGYCGQFVYAPGPFATNASVVYVDKATMSLNCGGNGINNLAGNTLSVKDSVIQGFNQYGILSGVARGGFGPTTVDNVYEEIGSCANPLYTAQGALTANAKGMAGGLVMGNSIKFTGGESPNGSTPTFACSASAGANQLNYWIVAKSSTLGSSAPLYAGKTGATCSGNVTVMFPRIAGADNGYDIIRNTGAGAAVQTPYTAGCTGGSPTACGSVSTTTVQCSALICTYTDSAAVSTTSYTVANVAFKPKLWFWPGHLVLGAASDTNSASLQSWAFLDEMPANSLGAAFVSIAGASQASVFSRRCAPANGQTGIAQCLVGDPVGNNNGEQVATLFPSGNFSGGSASEAGVKGRINFWRSSAANVSPAMSLITLVDSDPKKTAAVSSMRPAMDANDTYIGVDHAVNVSFANAQLATGAPISQSWYIASLPDNTNYKMRLNSSSLSLKTDLTTTGSFTMTGGAGTFNVAAALKTVPHHTAAGAPAGADCTISGQTYFRTDGTPGQQVYYCNGAGTWTLQTGGGGGGAWDTLSSPSGNQSLNMANFTSTWTGGTGLTNPLLTITDTTGDTFTGFLQQITSAGTSTAKGLGITVPSGGTAAQFQAGATGIALNIPTGQGYIKGDRFVSTSANAATTGCVLCLGTTDSITYRNSGLASTMTLIQGGDSGPVHVGDTPGVDIAGTLTSRSAGQAIAVQPLAATGNGNGGDLTLTTGNGSGTGAPGNLHLLPGSGAVNGGGGLIDAGSTGWSVKITNDNAAPPVLNGPVCLTSSGNAKVCDTGAQAGAVGICMANCTNTGQSTVTHTGWAIAAFDGSPVTAGDYFSVSTTSGQVTDVGPRPNTTQMALGVVGSLVSGSNYNVFVFASSPVVSLANVVTTNPASGNVVTPTSPTQIPLVLQGNAAGSVDLLQVKKGDGTVAMKVSSTGVLTVGTTPGTVTANQFLSDSSNVASSAASNKLRLATSDVIAWRNNANTGDVTLGKNNSDYLAFVNSPGWSVTPAGSSFTTTITATAPAQNQNLAIPDVGGASDTFAMRDMVQTLTNKKIGDSLSFANLGATPSNPAAGTLKVYSKTDQLCQVTSGGTETCFSTGGGGGTALSAVTAAAGTNTISNGDNAQIWNWTLTTAAKNAFKFGEAAAAINGAGSQYLLNVSTLASSTAKPLGVFARGTSNGFFVDSVTGNPTLAGSSSFDTSTAGALVVEIPNDGATGTTANLLCKLTTSNTCIKTTTSDLAGIEGIVVAGAGTTGNAQVAREGVAVCTFSNATTVGDYVGGSGTTAGNCLDLGSQPTAGAQVLGRVLTAGAPATNQSVLLYKAGAIPISGTANQITTAYASGALTLATPQDIHTTATPQFATLNLSSSTPSVRGATNAQDLDVQCGRNAGASVACQLTVRGADQTGTGNVNAGSVKVRGGNNASTGTGVAGGLDLQAGLDSAAANLNGYIKISAGYIKGATYTANAVVCFSANSTVSDCSTSQVNPIGTAYSSNGTAAIVAIEGSQVTLNYDATVSPSAGWYACLSSVTAGKVTAQAGPCPIGRQVGIIEASGTNVTSGTVLLRWGSPPDGPTFATLTDGATITYALNSAPMANATVTLGGNRTLNITNPLNGGNYLLKIVQDGTGGRTLALGTGCTWKVSGGGSGAISLSAGANAIDILAWTYDGTNCYANLNKNFN